MGEAIGLIPAAGLSQRLAPLPFSKELYPIGFWQPRDTVGLRPKTVSHNLIERMHSAGIDRIFVVIREGKWDIPGYLKDGSAFGVHLAYLMLGLPYGVPYTIDQAFPFIQDNLVAFGFPDILFDPADVFTRLLNHQKESQADVTLGLFPTTEPHKVDMIDLDHRGDVTRLLIRPEGSTLALTWGIAAWRPSFTDFLHRHLLAIEHSGAGGRELSMGEVFNSAISSGLRLDSIIVSNEPYLDIGTPEDLLKAAVSIR